MSNNLLFMFWQTTALVNVLTIAAVVAIIVFFAVVIYRWKKENPSAGQNGEDK